MRVKSVHLVNYKRFTDLTIDGIPAEAKAVVMVGPNGCGKSCVFDAFEQVCTVKKENWRQEEDYHAKTPGQEWNTRVTVYPDITFTKYDQKATQEFAYIRSPYRYTPNIAINQLQALPEALRDHDRPHTMKDMDQRLSTNYQRLIVAPIIELYSRQLDELTGKQIREKYVGEINAILQRLLDVHISDVGDPLSGRGQFYFKKGSITNFPYKNLSSGEKEVIDLVVDFTLKRSFFDDTIYCIDEPELHISTQIQGNLLSELIGLIPDSCQLWVATHSLGILRKASSTGSAVLLDFTDADFDKPVAIRPAENTRDSYRRMFSVALEDLTDLLLSSTIVFCEGETPQQDERLYRIIFADLRDTDFVAAGNSAGTKIAAARYAGAVTRGLAPKAAYALTDRDGLNDSELDEVTGRNNLIVLRRYSLENYLIDPEIMSRYCNASFDFDEYVEFLTGRVQAKLATVVFHKVWSSREHILKHRLGKTDYEPRVTDHPLLDGSLDPVPGNWERWIPLIPGKEFVGDVLEWVRSGGRTYEVDLGHLSKDQFLVGLAECVQPGTRVHDELSGLIETALVSST